MAQSQARPAKGPEAASPAVASPLRAARSGSALPRGTLDPLIRALTLAVDRQSSVQSIAQSTAQSSALRDSRTD